MDFQPFITHRNPTYFLKRFGMHRFSLPVRKCRFLDNNGNLTR